jgi:hypothetical protein
VLTINIYIRGDIFMQKSDEKSDGNGKVIPIGKRLSPKYSTDDFFEDEDTDREKEEFGEKQFKFGPDFVYRRSTDKKGHSILHATRVSPWVSSVIQTVVEHKGSPYKNSSEFIRDAIFQRLQYWAEKLGDKEMKQSLYKRGFTAWVEDQEELMTELQDSKTRFRKTVLDFLNHGKTVKMDKYIRGSVMKAQAIDYGNEPNEHLFAIRDVLLELGIAPGKYIKG